jgi:geranylgeranyl diphosphate synthase type II
MLSLGGKRLRPVLVLMACELFDDNIEKALPAALAVEVFHNFTLVHDDIMDKADIRRGKPTVHKKWNETVAILSGDLMMIKAIDILCETKYHQIPELIRIFNKTAAEVCEGQQLDMNFEQQVKVSKADYINMITLKTAVLLGGSLKLGALIGGATHDDASHVYELGKNIGIAFQIQDDILDSFGDGSIVGKKIGGDISVNKKTLLLLELMESANEADHLLIKQALTETTIDKKIETILQLYKKYDVKEKAEETKKEYLKLAFAHLDALSISPERSESLRQTAIELMERMS